MIDVPSIGVLFFAHSFSMQAQDSGIEGFGQVAIAGTTERLTVAFSIVGVRPALSSMGSLVFSFSLGNTGKRG